ncbi:YdcF family protein [Mameliella alba]|nr:YdcF family protein [Mameliella alba]MBY6170798.1 YdcF family protein [Mameliella alba]MBY6175811.1 YdcF family protein [Mameliella alba]
MALVLGAAVRADGSPSPALKRRTLHAVDLWRRGDVRALILSGGTRTHPPTEAEVMARLCRAEGMPDTALVLEPEALTTEDNMRLSAPLVSRMGAPCVVVVTDRYHAARACLVARRAGLTVCASCPGLTGAPAWRVMRAWSREAVAFAWYWLRGAGR